MVLIGLAGKKGVGKSTVAKGIVSLFENATIESFAAPIRRFAQDCGFDMANKETGDADLGTSPRVFMQLCGTEFVREMIAEDFWIRSLKRRLMLLPDDSPVHEKVCVIEDVRFINEAEFIMEHGGMVIYLDDQRVVGEDDLHPSENDLSPQHCHETVINNHNVADSLGRAVEEILYAAAAHRGSGIRTKLGVLMPRPVATPPQRLFMRPRYFWDSAIVGTTANRVPVYSRQALSHLIQAEFGDAPLDEWIQSAQQDGAIAPFHVITMH